MIFTVVPSPIDSDYIVVRSGPYYSSLHPAVLWFFCDGFDCWSPHFMVILMYSMMVVTGPFYNTSQTHLSCKPPSYYRCRSWLQPCGDPDTTGIGHDDKHARLQNHRHRDGNFECCRKHPHYCIISTIDTWWETWNCAYADIPTHKNGTEVILGHMKTTECCTYWLNGFMCSVDNVRMQVSSTWTRTLHNSLIFEYRCTFPKFYDIA